MNRFVGQLDQVSDCNKSYFKFRYNYNYLERGSRPMNSSVDQLVSFNQFQRYYQPVAVSRNRFYGIDLSKIFDWKLYQVEITR